MSFITDMLKWRVLRMNAAGTAPINPVTGLGIATLGTNTVTVGAGGMYSSIQAAINSITDNLPLNYSTGTVAVTNGNATITFSSAPAADKVVAGRDLFSVDGVRWYQIKSGPTITGGVIFNLAEVYQGSTNPVASFGVYKPNPRTVLLLPGVYDYTDASLARNILLKPYVNLIGLDQGATIIRRNKNDPTSTTTPVIGMAHGCVLYGFSIDTVDGHFDFYRMGLTSQATTQTQAMAGSKWTLRNIALLNKDPNGIDAGADYLINNSYFNGDELQIDDCYFEHCWDGFTFNTAGAGRLLVTLSNPIVYKLPTPLSLSASGACFLRAGNSGNSTTDVVMVNPVWNQDKYCAGEVLNDGLGGFIANAGGVSALLGVGGGATGKVTNPTITADFGLNYGHCGGLVLLGSVVGSTLNVFGGSIRVKGMGASGSHVGGVVQNVTAACTLNIQGTDIEADNAGIYNVSATSTTNVHAGSRIKGTNAINAPAGVVNVSPNADTIGANTGAGTINATAT